MMLFTSPDPTIIGTGSVLRSVKDAMRYVKENCLGPNNLLVSEYVGET